MCFVALQKGKTILVPDIVGFGVGLTLVRSHLWRVIVSIMGHRVKRSFRRASVTMAFFDEIDCELDESFILQSDEGK